MTARSPEQSTGWGPQPGENDEPPFVSIVVPVRNEGRFIRRTLEALLHQDYDPERFEVLVADGESTDDTVRIVRDMQPQHGNLRLLANPRRWSSAGRNRAVTAARGDVLVVVDGHCELSGPDYLTRLMAAFRRSGAACIGRPQPLDVTGASRLQRAVAVARSSWLGHHPESHIYSDREAWVRPQSVAVAYHRSVFEMVGLFDESFDACEDVEFNHRVDRAGLDCFFTPDVAVRYHPRGSLAGLFRQMVRYGRGRVRLLCKHPETFSPLCLAPGLWVLGLVVGPLLAWFSTWLALVYGGALGFYALVVSAVSASLAWRQRDATLLAWLPPVFAAIHAGAGAGIVQELVARLFAGPVESKATHGWEAVGAGTAPK
ncbi:MAG: glycosyltransferase family 2 protein [Planctomycetia bacterium]|nr:glycosyltransferase family 2 protein [Planctomycetia bacterium]